MATISVKAVKASDREKAIREFEGKGFQSLSGGLQLPEGTHKFHVADKAAFGILSVEGAPSGNWALPIVAGTMEVKEGEDSKSYDFTLDTGANAKNLVIPNDAYLAMALNGTYAITIGTRKGRKVVTAVNSYDAQAEEAE